MEKPDADLRHELEESRRFQTLLSEISARFVNLPADRIDVGIQDARRRNCESLAGDLGALRQLSDEKTKRRGFEGPFTPKCWQHPWR